jgi:APA family basic amino acid/polyamine antiporter
MALLVLFVDLTRVVAVSTFSLLFYYSLANVSALRLKVENRVYPKIVPFLGTTTCIALLAFTLSASPQACIVGVGVLTAGAVYYLVKRSFT